MNATHIEHLIIAALTQLALWPLFGPWAAGAIAVAVFLGREIMQHEYALAIHRGWQWGEVPPVKWYEGLIHHWTLDSLLDVAVPALGCTVVALIIGRFL